MELTFTTGTTRQRAALARMMDDLESFLSAQEIHARLRESGAAVGLTTVYRNLQTMAERGEVDVVRRGDGEALFRKCETREHHHHIICRSCGFSVEIENDDVERWALRAARRHGYTEVTHDLELFGVCETCSADS
ncbi:MAG: transcriptional repressor [Actinomycetota bacterium]|nr:transcriptional repressor [Actinomycetota bacterium]